MTLTESLVSSFILVALTTQTGRLFGDSMQALGKSRARDTVNAAIQSENQQNPMSPQRVSQNMEEEKEAEQDYESAESEE